MRVRQSIVGWARPADASPEHWEYHERAAMKKLIVFVFLLAIVARPGAVLGAENRPAEWRHRRDTREWPREGPRDRTVPEPGTMLLMGAAAGVAGVPEAAAEETWVDGRRCCRPLLLKRLAVSHPGKPG